MSGENNEHRDRSRLGIRDRVTRRLREFGALLRAAVIEYERDRARYLAVAMIYYAIVSFMPLLLLLLSALGLLLRFSAVAAEVKQQMLLGVEDSFGPELVVTVNELLNSLQQESILATGIGLAGILLTASVLFKHLRLSFRAIWHYDPPLISGVRVMVRTTILERVIAVAMLLGGGVLLVAALGLMATTQFLNSLPGIPPMLSQPTGILLAVFSSLILAAITFAFLFKYLPPRPLRWSDVWLATLLCAVAWVAASEALALSGSLFGASAYGVIGGLLVFMLWMKIVSQVLFFGAELCKVVATRSETF